MAAVLFAATLLAAEEPARDATYFYKQGMEAYEKKDFDASAAGFARALELAPGHPRMIYNLAAASSLAGRADQAIGNLERLARMDLYFDLEADTDFAALRADPRFRAVLDRMKVLLKPAGGGDVAFRLARPDFIPEGIAHDPVTGDFFVGSVRGRQIARVSSAGRESVLIPEGRDGLWSVLGMAVDPVRRTLWACSSALPNMIGGKPDEPPRGALFSFDLETGRLLARRDVAGGGEGHDCNDLVVSPSGDVFVSDSRKGSVLKTSASATALETFLPEGTFGSPQGLALTRDGRRLYVADYARGLFAVEMATREVTRLPVPDDVASRGVDGLLWRNGYLVAIQNGVTPHRLTLLRLDPAGEKVERQEILGMSHALYDEPTLGVIAGNALHYVANSQWGKFGKDQTSLPSEGLRAPVILRLPLP